MKSIPMDYTEEETIARREAMLKRMLATPPQHRTAKGDKANPPKKRGRPKKDKELSGAVASLIVKNWLRGGRRHPGREIRLCRE